MQRPRTKKVFSKTYLNYLIEEWKLKRRVNLYHRFVIGITFPYAKKIFRSVVNLHYENTLFRFLFHLEVELPIKTVLKFQQNCPIVNKVTKVEKLSIPQIKVIFLYKLNLMVLLRGNARYRPSKLYILSGVTLSF